MSVPFVPGQELACTLPGGRKIRAVHPLSLSGLNMSLAQLFGSGPKFTIQCGDCAGHFQERLSGHINNPGVHCHHCRTINVLPVTWE